MAGGRGGGGQRSRRRAGQEGARFDRVCRVELRRREEIVVRRCAELRRPIPEADARGPRGSRRNRRRGREGFPRLDRERSQRRRLPDLHTDLVGGSERDPGSRKAERDEAFSQLGLRFRNQARDVDGLRDFAAENDRSCALPDRKDSLEALGARQETHMEPAQSAKPAVNGNGCYDYDLLVIGSGPAGHHAALEAAKNGQRVGVIDRCNELGGVCLHTGTIPSKTLREAALYLSGFRQRSFYGRGYRVKAKIQIQDLMFRVSEVIKRQFHVIQDQLQRQCVELLDGYATFTSDPHVLEVALAG